MPFMVPYTPVNSLLDRPKNTSFVSSSNSPKLDITTVPTTIKPPPPPLYLRCFGGGGGGLKRSSKNRVVHGDLSVFSGGLLERLESLVSFLVF